MRSALRFLCCYIGWHKYKALLDEEAQKQCWMEPPSDFIAARAEYFRCETCGKTEILLSMNFSSKKEAI